MTRAARAFTLLEVLIVLGAILILATLVLGVSSAVLKGAESAQMRSSFNTMEAAFAEWESVTGRPVSYCGTGIDPPSGGVNAAFDIWEPTGVPPGATTANARTIAIARGVGVYAVNLLMQVESVKSVLAGIPPHLLRAEASNNVGAMYPPANVPWTGVTSAQIYLPSAAQMLGSVSGNNPRPMTSRGEFVDPWGNRVAFVFPGREARITDDGVLVDSDGTVRTDLEKLDVGFGVCAASRICLVSAGPDGVFGVDGDAPGTLSAADRMTFRRTAAADNVYLYDLDPPDN